MVPNRPCCGRQAFPLCAELQSHALIIIVIIIIIIIIILNSNTIIIIITISIDIIIIIMNIIIVIMISISCYCYYHACSRRGCCGSSSVAAAKYGDRPADESLTSARVGVDCDTKAPHMV